MLLAIALLLFLFQLIQVSGCTRDCKKNGKGGHSLLIHYAI